MMVVAKVVHHEFLKDEGWVLALLLYQAQPAFDTVPMVESLQSLTFERHSMIMEA